jgi:hypothetical protein
MGDLRRTERRLPHKIFIERVMVPAVNRNGIVCRPGGTPWVGGG